MEETEVKSSSPFSKLVVYGIVGLLLVVFPAISYIYLKDGFKWRVQAQSELQDYGKIRAAYVVWQDGSKEDLLKGKVCVVHQFEEQPDLTPANQRIIDLCEELHKQYGFKPGSDQNDFRLAMVAEGQTAAFKSYIDAKPSAEMATWVWTGGMGSWTTILKNGFDYYCIKNNITPYEDYFALTDTSGVIRRFYNAQDPAEVDRMVQQIALLLPNK